MKKYLFIFTQFMACTWNTYANDSLIIQELRVEINQLKNDISDLKAFRSKWKILLSTIGGISILTLVALIYERIKGIKSKAEKEVNKVVKREPRSENIVAQKADEEVEIALSNHPVYKEVEAIEKAKQQPILIVSPKDGDGEMFDMLNNSGFNNVKFISHNQLLADLRIANNRKLIIVNNRNGEYAKGKMAEMVKKARVAVKYFFYYNDTGVKWENGWVENFRMANYASNLKTLEDNLLKTLK